MSHKDSPFKTFVIVIPKESLPGTSTAKPAFGTTTLNIVRPVLAKHGSDSRWTFVQDGALCVNGL